MVVWILLHVPSSATEPLLAPAKEENLLNVNPPHPTFPPLGPWTTLFIWTVLQSIYLKLRPKGGTGGSFKGRLIASLSERAGACSRKWGSKPKVITYNYKLQLFHVLPYSPVWQYLFASV